MRNCLAERFDKCRRDKKTALIIYITAGDPDFATSLKIALSIADSGADILELGVPFSDPLADGEANQLAAERALSSGMNSLKVLDLACEIRKKCPDLPLVLFTYLNPVAYSGRIGFRSFCRKATKCGIDAILPLDLPPEEAESGFGAAIEESGLKLVTLVTPNTPPGRVEYLAGRATGFVYYASREGVTGESKKFSANFSKKISMIKKHTRLPVVVGFGISSADHAKTAANTGVDGIVVGSAVVRKIEALSRGEGSIVDISSFTESLGVALHR